MKKIYLVALATILACNSYAQKIEIDQKLPKAEANIFVISDAGRNGSFDQKRIGEVMGVYADSLGPEFVVNCGDMFHYDGVQSVNDPILFTNFEQIYPAGELQCKWWGVLGNHEYRGSTQAVIDYSNVSRRWNVPSQYYAKTFEGANDKDSILIVFMDTAPMIDKYRIEEAYPDAHSQNPDKQIAWIDSTFSASKAKWKIAVGHHPIYSYSKKDKSETDQMQERLAKVFQKNNVHASFSGHVHTFQHLKPTNAKTEYFVSPSASRARLPINGEFTHHNNDKTGFIILGVNNESITLSMIDKDGKIVYNYTIK